MMLPDPKLPWPIPLDAVRLIAEHEQGPSGGCALKAYQCPASVWTIGWGETEDVKRGDRCTKEQADTWLCEDLDGRAKEILAMCTETPLPNELGAMVSLAYNIGMAGFKKSTVLKAHNKADHQSAARAFSLWNKTTVAGQLTELPGLTARRTREAALYLTPESDDVLHRMPQKVETETPMAQSTTIQGASIVGTVGVVGGIAQVSGTLQGLGESVKAAKSVLTETLGIPTEWFLWIALIVIAWVMIRDRLKRRSDGYI